MDRKVELEPLYLKLEVLIKQIDDMMMEAKIPAPAVPIILSALAGCLVMRVRMAAAENGLKFEKEEGRKLVLEISQTINKALIEAVNFKMGTEPDE